MRIIVEDRESMAFAAYSGYMIVDKTNTKHTTKTTYWRIHFRWFAADESDAC